MTESDAASQAEELEALKAIYDTDFRVVCLEESTYAVHVQCGSLSVELQFILPPDYPSCSPPVYELSLPWMDPSEAQYIAIQLFDMFSKVKGQAVVHQWAEWVRDYITMKAAEVEDKSEFPTVDAGSPHELSSPGTGAEEAPQTESGAGAGAAAVRCPEVIHGQPLTEKKSTFQSHVAVVSSVEEVKTVLDQLKTNKKIAAATHNILAYRLCNEAGDSFTADYDDDGETSAGGKLLHLLELMDVRNAVVVVTRWYGGIFLYGDRFRLINVTARTLLQESRVGLQHKTLQDIPAKNSKKSSKSKSKFGRP